MDVDALDVLQDVDALDVAPRDVRELHWFRRAPKLIQLRVSIGGLSQAEPQVVVPELGVRELSAYVEHVGLKGDALYAVAEHVEHDGLQVVQCVGTRVLALVAFCEAAAPLPAAVVAPVPRAGTLS